MSIISRAEFATICGTTPAIVNTNVSRGKIIPCGEKDKNVDTENWTNKQFKKKCEDNAKKAKPVRVKKAVEPIEEIYNKVVEKVEPKPKSGTREETEEEKEKRKKQNEDSEEDGDWTRRKTVADALRAEQLAEKERLNVEKLMGQLIPFDLMKLIIKVNIQDILKSFVSESTNLASIYCDILADGDREKLAELTNKLQYTFETIVRRVETTTAKEIENVIEEFAESRTRGEKK
jgi:hypothetical protein